MSNIEWTDRTWNPMTGCDKVSPGCRNCYAAGVANRFWGDRSFTDVEFHGDRLGQPHKWQKSQRIFVNSMSDFFHDSITNEQRDQCLGVMVENPQHTFQVLTKRAGQLRKYLEPDFRSTADQVFYSLYEYHGEAPKDVEWPLPNVWWGVSVEDQVRTNRIQPILDTPCAVRFLSCEPLLEPIDLTPWLLDLDWVIVGGESGPGARPCHVEWLQDIVAQCQSVGVPVFVKQTGSNCWQGKERIKVQGSKKGGDTSWLQSLGLLIRNFPTQG